MATARAAAKDGIYVNQQLRLVVASGGRVRDEWLAWVRHALNASIVRVYSEVDTLPPTLPDCDVVVGIQDSMPHRLEEQIKLKRPKGARYFRLSRKTSSAATQLSRLGFRVAAVAAKPTRAVVSRQGKKGGVEVVTSFPSLQEFTQLLVRRVPTLSVVDAARLRHHEDLDTPFRFSKSIHSVWQAIYAAAKAEGQTAKAAGFSDWDKVKQAAVEVMAGFGTPPGPKMSELHKARLRVLAAWADNLILLGGKPAERYRGGSVSPIFDEMGWDLPLAWDHLRDAREAMALVEPWLWRKKTQLGVDEIRAALLAASRGEKVKPFHVKEAERARLGLEQRRALAKEEKRKAKAAKLKPKKPVPKPPVPASVPAALTAAASGSEAFSAFVGKMQEAHPEMSLSDMAWLRQQSEIWPIRHGDRAQYFAAWRVCWESRNTTPARADRGGQGRKVKDTDLLRAAYAVLEDTTPRTVPKLVQLRLDRIGRIAAFLQSGPYRMGLVRTGQLIANVARALPGDAKLERTELEEARDLSGISLENKSAIALPVDWFDRLVAACRRPVADIEQPESAPKSEPRVEVPEPEPRVEVPEPEPKVEVKVEEPEPEVEEAKSMPKVKDAQQGGDTAAMRRALKPVVELAAEVMERFGMASVHLTEDGGVQVRYRVVVEAEDNWKI